MRPFAVLVFVYLGAGCRTVDIELNPTGLKELAQYQLEKELESLALEQLKDEYDSDPSMRFEDYHERRQQISSYSKSFPKNDVLRINNFVINNRGHLKIDIKGKRSEDGTYDYGPFKTRRESPVRLRTGLNIHGNFKLGIEIEDFEVWGKVDRNAEWEVQAKWVFKF